MGDLAIPLLVVGGAFGVLGSPGLVFLALEARERGQRRAPRFYAKAALWSGFVVYAGLALAAFLQAKNLPTPGPIWEFAWSGVARLPFLGQVALGVNALAVLWAWLILRDEEDHPDRAMVAAALAEEREEEEDRRRRARSLPTASGAGPAPPG
jgi:hypothetical protein